MLGRIPSLLQPLGPQRVLFAPGKELGEWSFPGSEALRVGAGLSAGSGRPLTHGSGSRAVLPGWEITVFSALRVIRLEAPGVPV